MFQFYDVLNLMWLPRADFDIFGNNQKKSKKNAKIPYLNAWAKSMAVFLFQNTLHIYIWKITQSLCPLCPYLEPFCRYQYQGETFKYFGIPYLL